METPEQEWCRMFSNQAAREDDTEKYHCENCYRNFEDNPVYALVLEEAVASNGDVSNVVVPRTFCSEECSMKHRQEWEVSIP